MNAFQGFPRITPFLWFDGNVEEAVDFYLTVFKNSRRLDELRTTEEGPGPKGSILTIEFELDGQKFTALNGGPQFKFNEAVSFVVRCDSQKEVDHYWSKLTAGGGSESQCGWLKDKFGLSWQIVPARLPDLLKHPKAVHAMLQMKKLDIAELERAAHS
ncbi:MAG TPA: VOC family protein [Edaphobacter sp.]|jgi:predicted 3-demethylubiquinone-9 3-methyltransferase (glyoxalase superfamily)|nr:VOC family protein [Edaphobacter sp.]